MAIIIAIAIEEVEVGEEEEELFGRSSQKYMMELFLYGQCH